MRPAALLISISALVACGCSLGLDFPDTFPLHKRQTVEPGTPAYDCHADCGGVITVARTPNYCQNSTYESELAACLKCALQFDIWKYYGASVSKAAQACGDDATPSPAVSASSAVATPSAQVSPAHSSLVVTEGITTPTPASTRVTSAAFSALVTSSIASASSAATSGSSASIAPTASSNVTVTAATSSASTQPFEGSATSVYVDGSLLGLSAVVACGLGIIAFNV